MSLEIAHKVIVPQKRIMSHSFLNSGTLIVIACLSGAQMGVESLNGKFENLITNFLYWDMTYFLLLTAFNKQYIMFQ